MAYGPGDRGSGARASRGRSRPRRRQPGPPNFPTAVPVRPGAVTGPPPTRGHGPPPPPRPTFALPKLERAPGQHAAQRAARKAQAAKPAPVLPQIPVIRNPTHAQTQAAKALVTAGVREHVRRSGLSTKDAIADLKSDPRARQFIRAADHYARASRRQGAAQAGAYAGVPRQVSVTGVRRGPLPAGDYLVSNRINRIRAGRGLYRYQRQRDVVRQGTRPPQVSALGVNITPSQIMAAAKGVTSLDTGDIGPRNLANRIGGDIKTLATGPFIGAYELGASAVEGFRGRPYLAAVPLLGQVAAAASSKRGQRLGSGIAKGYAQEATHPLQYAGQHPLLAALDVTGAAGAAGRVAGVAARLAGTTAEAGGIRGALARGGSRVRSPLALSQDASAPIVERQFSPRMDRKIAQMVSDARREPLRDAEGNVVMHEQAGRKVPVLQATPSERVRHLKREANFNAARANALERKVRDQVDHEFKAHGVKGRKAKDLVAMVVEGTVSDTPHFSGDLAREADRIEGMLKADDAAKASGGERVFRHSGEREAAEHRLGMLEDAITNPKILRQAERIVEAGKSIGARLNDMEAEAIRQGILHPKRAARSRLIVPAVAHMDARHFSSEELGAALGRGPADEGLRLGVSQVSEEALKHGALRHPDGRFLSNADIEETLRAKGRDPATVAYLPHRMDVRGRRAFHTRFPGAGRPVIDKPGVRTGSAYRKGATEASYELIREQAARLATQTTKAGSIDRLVTDYGMRRADGQHYTPKEAHEQAERLAEETGEEWLPFSAFPSKAGKGMEARARGAQAPGEMETLQQKLFKRRLVKPGDKGKPNVVLMPKPLLDQLGKHLQPPGTVEKFFQALNPMFRFAVLPQPRWLAGNFIEPYFVRLPVEGSGITNIPGMGADFRATHKIRDYMLNHPDERVRRAGAELDAQQWGQGLFIGGRGASNRRTLAELGRIGAAAAVIRQLPVVKQMVDLMAMAPKSFFAMNRVIETGAQHAGFGRLARREIREFTGSWWQTVRLGPKALEELAQGLTNTSTQRRFMRAQHALLGQYEGFSPGVRRMVQSVTPFVPWYASAARFVLWTMPAHHTELTSLLVKTSQVFQQDWDQIHKDVPPGGLKFAIPTARGGWIDLARYTPAGAFTEQFGGGSWDSLVSQIAPQFSGMLAALRGQDPFGRELQAPKSASNPEGKVGTWGQLWVALNQEAGSLIPGYSQAQRLREGGRTPYATSSLFSPKTKPGTEIPSAHIGPITVPPAVRRTYDPFRPTQLKKGIGQGGAGQVVPPTPGPMSRQDRILLKAAERQAGGGLSDRQLEILTRAALRGR